MARRTFNQDVVYNGITYPRGSEPGEELTDEDLATIERRGFFQPGAKTAAELAIERELAGAVDMTPQVQADALMASQETRDEVLQAEIEQREANVDATKQAQAAQKANAERAAQQAQGNGPKGGDKK